MSASPVRIRLRRTVALPALVLVAAALLAGPVLTGVASAAPPSDAQSANLQQKVAGLLANHPSWRQVSPDKIMIEGGSLTLTTPGHPNGGVSPQLACRDGHLCILDGRGALYDYYFCGYYSFDGVGDGTFNNNQSWGTRARFYNADGSERWSDVAKDSGPASWTPVWFIRPC
jgi:hypothetical protein